jgi:two-component system KDP operon response regulator KdpE
VTRVLLVEDDENILTTLAIMLRAEGYEVECATTAAQALTTAAAVQPQLVVLDLGLPDRNGTEVIRALRTWTSIPIVILSGRTEAGDKVTALDLGADDYVTKPFTTEELLARLRAVQRRAREDGGACPVVEIGRYAVDFAARTVTVIPDRAASCTAAEAPADVGLSPTEWAVLELLVRHPGRLISRQELATGVWGAGRRSDSDSPRTYLARLRRKLESDPARPQHLLTEPGMGYRFQP